MCILCTSHAFFHRPRRRGLYEIESKWTSKDNIHYRSMSDMMSRSLTVKDLGTVYKDTFDARGRWNKIFLELGLDIDTIKSIGTRSGQDPDDCYLEGLTVWLKGGERSWRDLVEALSSPTVRHTDIAREIERKYLTQVAIQGVPSDTYRQPITGELVIFTDQELGNGAFGAVFKGSYREMPCAVKLLHQLAMRIKINLPVGPAAAEAVKTFDRESEFLKSFQHPNIVQHLSTEKHPTSGNTILVIELMDCNLRGYFSSLSEESLSSDCQLSLSRDVASGLAYIHSKHIIHRDLCGDNILLKLVQPVPIAKISDFGMSRLLDPSQVSSTLTAVGHRKGYLPPEASRLEEEQYDYSLDVFSLGVIMVQIVLKLETVKSPRDRAESVVQIPDTHVLKPLINKCLQEDMRNRSTASKVYYELNQGTGAKTVPTQTDPEAKPPQLPRVPSSITFNWRRCRDRPHDLHYQPVALNGKLYVRGINSQRKTTILQYKPHNDRWKELPLPPVHSFTVATLKDQLLVVGGRHKLAEKRSSNAIFIFDDVYSPRRWVQFYPAMPIEVINPAVIGYQDYLIVASGWNSDDNRVTDVNILNTSTNKWIRAESLPSTDCYYTVLIEDTVYLVGQDTKHVLRAHVPTLAAGVRSGHVWERVTNTPYPSTPSVIDNTLLTMGNGIHMYDSIKNQWTRIGDLPERMDHCCCTVLSGELFVLGSYDDRSRSVFVAKLSINILV